jgi:phosphorylase/glycogen(starch) synthase
LGQTLFEVSWEIANKVGGIHTVVSTKAQTMVAEKGDNYVCIGPWLMFDEQGGQPFDDEPGFEPLIDSCRELGVPIRVGRWRIPGRPRTILVEFSGLYEHKDQVLAELWERFHVDSLFGGWEYIEPLMFGHACGIVIEQFWQEFVAPYHHDAVAQFHEWMSASGALYIKHNRPSIGTVFTAHSTALGRVLSSTGQSPTQGLAGQSPEELAEAFGMRSVHSLEGVAARECDVFSTVSEVTAQEAELFHYRKAAPILPNGIDLDVIEEMAGPVKRDEARRVVLDLASRFHGEDLSDASIISISGRYEFHNKGLDAFLDAMVDLEGRYDKKVLALLLVPAGNSGLRQEVGKRMHMPLEEITGSLGISTHNHFDGASDPILSYCKRIGLDNDRSRHVKILQIPVYLTGSDGILNIPHEAVLRACDLTVFPSFYEPWGYTPQESLGLGVPTITSDFAGFGRYCDAEGIGHEQGVDVLQRMELPYEEIGPEVARLVQRRLVELREGQDFAATCRETAQRTGWQDLIANYREAWDRAIEMASSRKDEGLRPMVRQRPLPVRPRRDAKRPRLFQFDVAARVPQELEGLVKLAENYWWSWDAEAMQLFEEISPVRWEICAHNPIQFLQEVFPQDLEEKAKDADFVARLNSVLERMNAYLAERPDWREGAEGPLERNPSQPVAYFCAEFGVHESLKIYSGGLGLLAGDHLKSASDLNIPLVAVGLFYSKGYMQQKLTVHGDQISLDQENDPRRLPMKLVRDESGEPILIELDFPGSKVHLRAWRVDVGRVPLYLLDADIEQNRPEDRDITAHLYGGASENRLRQEIVLGRGGVKLLQRMGVEPSVFHMNEGHAAFLALERVASLLREEGLTFEEAHEFVRRTTVFTTHTPVPAGHDRFGEELIRRYFGGVSKSVGIPWDRFYELGLADEDNASFNMSYFALNFSSVCNGVSKLHGEVSKSLFTPFWPELLESEIPVQSVTNGVHLPTWTMPELSKLYGVEKRPIVGEDFESHSESLDNEKLWEIRQRSKKRLLNAVKHRLESCFVERNDSPAILQEMLQGLDHRALVIGFARRFAPYKRAHLLFQDTEKLAEFSTTPSGRCGSSSPARRIRATAMVRRSSSASSR